MAKRFFYLFRAPGRKGTKSCKGTTATEMALLAPVFFMFLIGITELSLILAGQQLMENATFNASRIAKTGFVANGQTQTQTVNQIVTNELQSYGTMFDVSKITTTEVAYNNFTSIGQAGKGTNGFGTQKQIVVYTITYPWKLFTPMMGAILGTWNAAANGWVFNLTSQIVVQNEPFG